MLCLERCAVPAGVLPAGRCALPARRGARRRSVAGRPVCCRPVGVLLAGRFAVPAGVLPAGRCAVLARRGGAAEERGRPAGVLPASQMVCCWPAGVLAK